MQDSEFILLDEPFASLDSIKRLEIYNWIETHKDYINKSIILVTHDIDEAIFLSDQIIIMDSGEENFKFMIDINMSHPRESSVIIEKDFINQKRILIEKLDEVKKILNNLYRIVNSWFFPGMSLIILLLFWQLLSYLGFLKLGFYHLL